MAALDLPILHGNCLTIRDSGSDGVEVRVHLDKLNEPVRTLSRMKNEIATATEAKKNKRNVEHRCFLAEKRQLE
jgi:hypothetical protein